MEQANTAGVTPATRIMCPEPRPAGPWRNDKPARTVKPLPGTLQETGFVRLNQLLTVVGISSSTLLAWEKTGRFPASVKLGPRMTAWRAEAVRAWMESFK